MVGRVLILYRPHPDHPRIRLADSVEEEADHPTVRSERNPARPESIEEELV
jgi:hypothetical protein